MLFPGRLFMRLIKGSLAGLVLVGILAMMPAAAFAHGGGGGGGGHGGGGGGHGFGGGFPGGFARPRSGPALRIGGDSVGGAFPLRGGDFHGAGCLCGLL